MNRRSFLQATAGSTALAAQVASTAQTPHRPTRPNVVFFLFDKCRTDAVGAYPSDGVHTPNMDWIARTGTLYANCYTPQALCAPARASIVTGLYPHAHGLQKNDYPMLPAEQASTVFHEAIASPFLDGRFRLWDNFPLFLHASGYQTAHIGKWHMGVPNPGFFDTWKTFNSNLGPWVGAPHQSPYRVDVHTDQAIDFVKANAKNPFFLYLSFYPPHEDDDPPAEFLSQYRGKDKEHAAYYATVSNLDWNIGRVLDALRAENIIDNTLIIVTTDHGRTWRDLPGTRDGMSIAYEESARIPLLMRCPGVFSGGNTWKSGVSLIDLMPTILDVCGVTNGTMDTANNGTDPRAGKSLVGARDEWDRPIVIQNYSQQAYGNYFFQERGLRFKQWKLILRRFDLFPMRKTDELYDLDTDANETHNLIADRPDNVRELATMLETWADRAGDTVALELARRTLGKSQ
jgi:arylsulfatase A-like enzyme